ncbi:MAG: hypothetical protein HRT88_12850 [Lentisphaeraceae bacterium]|nr:hypothetical protein [Lentisphaeraceae bacterium]
MRKNEIIADKNKVTRKGRRARIWSKEEIISLGSMPAPAIAKIMGISVRTVMCKRKQLNISFRQEKRNWTEGELNIIRGNNTKDAADILGCSISTIGKLRKEHKICSAKNFKISWSEDDLKLLGSMQDLDLAKKLGIHQATVYRKRAELKIEKYRHS